MCADGAKPMAERFAYPNALVGLYRVGKDEGVATFARGVSANIVRSVLMSGSRSFPPEWAFAKLTLWN